MKYFWTAIKIILPLALITLLFYFLAVRPQQRQMHSVDRDIATTESGIAHLETELADYPQLSTQETKHLWPRLTLRTRQILTDESSMIQSLARLADMADRTGAEFTNMSIEDPPSDTVPVVRRTGRRGVTVEQAPREPTKVGDAVVQEYRVHLAIKGRYSAWARLFKNMSTEVVPVLLDGFTTRQTEDGGRLMLMTLTVPARKITAESAPLPDEKSLLPVELPHDVALRYHIDELTAPVAALYQPVDSDPFPYVAPVVEAAPAPSTPDWTLTAVLKRGDRYVAVINNTVLEVGQVYEGRKLVRITPDAAIFVRND